MEYYKILNLAREPFSNSPEPEFFFQSPKHISCLQQLELAIRLRRGLNVVMGHVGTGKTTLCRHIIRQFAMANEEADAVETHLIMDPAFSTPQEFLSTVAIAFGIAGRREEKASAEAEPTEWQIREQIKDYLFKRGVDEKKIVVLIIDEGQKLPDFCMEILREFLNYETNENKLLQIVIFAQEEFQLMLNRMQNVADRVNMLYLLEPLNFRETRDMIRFRIARAADPGPAPKLFTWPGLLAVYRATDGYPRKIITLCHQLMLALIIKNQTRAGWFAVRACAVRLPEANLPKPSLRWRRAAGVLIALLAVLTLTFAYWEQISDKFPLSVSLPTSLSPVTPQPAAPVAQQASQPPLPATVPAQSEPAAQAVVQKPASGPIQSAVLVPPPAPPAVLYPKPEYLGTIALKDGRTIWRLLTEFYGECNQDIFKSVAHANPQIRNLNRVNAGATIRLPALPVKGNPLPAGAYRVQLSASKNIEETYELYRTYKPAVPAIRFLPYWNPREGVVFGIFLKDGFPDETSARRGLTALPATLAAGAGILKDLDKETVFFTR